MERDPENPDAFNEVTSLHDNCNIFRAPVHDSIMRARDVNDKNFAWCLESHFGRGAHLEGFVC